MQRRVMTHTGSHSMHTGMPCSLRPHPRHMVAGKGALVVALEGAALGLLWVPLQTHTLAQLLLYLHNHQCPRGEDKTPSSGLLNL